MSATTASPAASIVFARASRLARPTHYCRTCDRDVVAPQRLSALGKAGTLLVGLGLLGAVIAASLIGPFIMFVVPFIALFGFALGPLVRMASEPPSCSSCHREVVYRSREEAQRARERANVRGA